MAPADFTAAKLSRYARSSLRPLANTSIRMNSGTTIKSWNIRMEKPAWPAGVCKERWSVSNCITTAVDDSDSTRPSTMDASSDRPK